MDERILKRLEACRELPSLPAAAARIVDLSQDPTASMGDVADAVGMDPALTTKLLRIANSPLYGQRRQSNNLRQAVMLLGLNATLTLALSFSLVSSLRCSKKNGLDYTLFWRRALLAATAARIIAKSTSKAASEECFLAALLQDLGMLALDQALPDLYDGMNALQQRDHSQLIAYEKERLRGDHADIGAWLLARWRFPESIVHAVGASHLSHLAATTEDEDEHALLQTVNVSGYLADMLLPQEPAQQWQAATERAQQYWAVADDWLDGIGEQLAEEIPEVEKLFDIQLLENVELGALLAEAKETLVTRSLQTIKQLDESQKVTDSIRERVHTMEAKSKRDGLTGSYNRSYMDELLREEFEQAGKHGWPLSVIFIDLDRFKQLNDNHGHAAGDQALRHAARLLEFSTRDSDTVARYGGEEFVVILPGVDTRTASKLAQRVVEAFRNEQLITESGEVLQVTISAGLATVDEGTAFDHCAALLHAADQAMYQAKAQGRDRLVVHGARPQRLKSVK